jgi:hypothetical protein
MKETFYLRNLVDGEFLSPYLSEGTSYSERWSESIVRAKKFDTEKSALLMIEELLRNGSKKLYIIEIVRAFGR